MTPVVEMRVSGIERLADAEMLLDERLLEAARSAFDEAEISGADPDRCSAGRWETAMLSGRFEDAWSESDAIRRRCGHDPHRFWNGEPIDGRRVIVRSLHGLGDAVQMFRYAPLLKHRAVEVTYEVPPRMVALAHCFRDVENVTTWGKDGPTAPILWDSQIEITELPYLFRTTEGELPIAEYYLHLPDEVVRATSQILGPKQRPRVGLVWACGDWNPQRNVPLALLESVISDKRFEFWNLQGSGLADEANGLPVRHDPALTDGLLPLASLIANLDLVITPDTMAAHVAGVLGTPAWVMLQYAADWRWKVHRSDSLWYRSLRLFRQRKPGDWRSVILDIERRLQMYMQHGPTALLF